MTDVPYSIRAVQRVCDILDMLQQHPEGLTLVDVVQAASLPKSSAFRYLATLEARGYVGRNESGDFVVGLRLRSERLDVLSQRIKPYLRKLRDELGETVNFGMLDGDRVVYLEIMESLRSMRNASRPAERESIHSTALGKVLVAWQPAEVVRGILTRGGMPAQTEQTITDIDTYLGELANVREQGYAVDDRENEPDGRCVAVPIPGLRIPVALSLSAPASRLAIEQLPAVAAALLGSAAHFGGTADLSPTVTSTEEDRA